MSSSIDSLTRTRVLVLSGMLGSGFDPEALVRGIALGADVIAIDGGSIDSGPHYLGTGTAKTAHVTVKRDVDLLVGAARAADVPLLIGSCGTSGSDSGVDRVYEMTVESLRDRGLLTSVASIYSEQCQDLLQQRVTAGRVRALPPASPLTRQELARFHRAVGLMGHEPMAAALADGARIVRAGRATDTAAIAVVPLMRGADPGAAWHAAKVAECGGLCTTSPLSGGVLVEVDNTGFTIEPLDMGAACTPNSVAAHLLYENADPFRLREPGGSLNTENAAYEPLDDRRVRVMGSAFEPAKQTTIKLEGAALVGYETMSLVGIRDPEILASIDVWSKTLEESLGKRVSALLGPGPGDYALTLRYYGWNAVLGDFDEDIRPHEVGVVLRARAATQETATAIAKIANPLLLHLPLPGMKTMPSFAFLSSPAEVPRGAVYEFVLQHAVDVASGTELFRTVMEEIA